MIQTCDMCGIGYKCVMQPHENIMSLGESPLGLQSQSESRTEGVRTSVGSGILQTHEAEKETKFDKSESDSIEVN